jgi:hypothetical protein
MAFTENIIQQPFSYKKEGAEQFTAPSYLICTGFRKAS